MVSSLFRTPPVALALGTLRSDRLAPIDRSLAQSDPPDDTARRQPNDRTVGGGDVRAQAERCFEITGDALERAGSG
jgi:hypothetical protein